MKEFLLQSWRRALPLFDGSAWLMAGVGLFILALLDWRTAATLAQWSLFALVVGALTIIISRITFPQIDLSELMDRVKAGDSPAARVVAALLIYCALVFIGVALWAK